MNKLLKCSAVLTILSVLLITLIIPVFAHPGSLDANGGHYDRSTGEYHYHHGYPAHQHTNGICPYDFKDNPNDDYSPKKNSSSSNSAITAEKNDDNATSLLPVTISFITTLLSLIFLAGKLICRIDSKKKFKKLHNFFNKKSVSVLAFYVIVYSVVSWGFIIEENMASTGYAPSLTQEQHSTSNIVQSENEHREISPLLSFLDSLIKIGEFLSILFLFVLIGFIVYGSVYILIDKIKSKIKKSY